MATISTNKLVQVLSDEELVSLQQSIVSEQTYRRVNKYKTALPPYSQEDSEYANKSARMQLIEKHTDVINQGRVVAVYDMKDSRIKFAQELANIIGSAAPAHVLFSHFPNDDCTGEVHIVFATNDYAEKFLASSTYKHCSSKLLSVVD